ncbi:hypothetical protein ACTJIJ_20920 [Niabella sp. 22666]|uniref:hypothetical protein n=1 Tax=Niabella sp. 22666 TaxID=3453954 RepID=UPI003F8333B0
MGAVLKRIAILPYQKDRKLTTVISGSSISIIGFTKDNQAKSFEFEVISPAKIDKERNKSYKYFSID